MSEPENKRSVPNPLVDRQKLLDQFGLVTEADIAILLGIDVKTLRNRPASKKPKMIKASQKRLSTIEWVKDFLESTAVTP